MFTSSFGCFTELALWHLFQTDMIVQALLHGLLDNVDIYIELPAPYACPTDYVLKLHKAIYGLHQAVKFKQEVVAWFLANGYMQTNDGLVSCEWIYAD